MKIDAATAIGATDRTVRPADRDGQGVYEVESRRRFSTSQADLWDAISSAERLPRWFLPVSGELREGGRYQLEGNASGTILRCEAPRLLSVTWEYGGGMSWLDVTLEPVAEDVTLLRLVHVVPDDDHWRQFGAGATGVGWDLGLLGLALHAEGGGSAVAAEGAAWAASPEGLDYMRQCAEAWREAHVRSGAPEGEAGEQAARTVAAYTGGG